MLDANTFTHIHQLYGSQSHFIDSGRAREWAHTFTADGEFDSPSYAEPERGRAALTAFAERFFDNARAAEEVHRHVVTNLAVERVDETTLTVDLYLQIMATPRGGDTRLVRFTTARDRVVLVDGTWLIAHRAITRDDT